METKIKKGLLIFLFAILWLPYIVKETGIIESVGLHGYFTNDAIVVATESRTSSPVRIPRNENTLHHPQIKNLFPCGEGAGYAGGIVSAAMDGERVADIISVVL